MSTPYTQVKGLPPRRIQKKPRVLSYNKCRFCRDPKVKTKCVWDRGSWPNKCQRCSDKGLPCSEPRHKAEEHDPTLRMLPEMSHTASHSVYTVTGLQPISMRATPLVLPELPGLVPLRPSAGPKSNAQPTHEELKRPVLKLSSVRCLYDDPGSAYQTITPNPQPDTWTKERLVLQLLPLHGMILMVLEEIKHLTRDFLDPCISEEMSISGGTYEKAVNDVCYAFQDSAGQVRQAIDKLAPHSKLAMKAALDLTRFSFLPQLPLTAKAPERWQNIQKVETVKERYYKQGHIGMANLLNLYQSTVEDPFQGHKISLMDMHLSNIDTCLDGCIMNSNELQGCVSTLRSLEWFTPTRSIANLPSARSRIRSTGFKDFLGRSVPLLEYDAGFPVHEIDILHDRPDHIGRTLLHVSCVKNDEQMLDILLAKGLICTTRTISGLSPLHIAATTGNLEIFKKLHAYYMSTGSLQAALNESDAYDSTFLELAARYGNSRIIEFYLSAHTFTRKQLERSHPDNQACASFVDQSGKIRHHATDVMLAFKGALRNDWTEVVLIMSCHLGAHLWDENHRTILWYASHYGRFNVIKPLFHEDLMNKPDILGRTPLMAAATAGHEKVLHRLCFLGGRLIGNANSATPSKNLLGLDLVDMWGNTARDLAANNGHPECAQFLEDLMKMASMTLP